jgi:5'-nucleotidase
MKRIYVDMDGVLCDFRGPFNKIHKEDGTHEQKFPQSRYGFFLNLEPMPGAIYAMKRMMQDFDLYILSRPSIKNPMCWTEKAVWVENHLGFDMLSRLILCSNKSLLMGDYLIDDQTEYGQTEFQGEFIHFGTEKFPDWPAVLSHLYGK